MSFSVGIVGLPNVGKSTLFKALTKKKVNIAPRPFTTIKPNLGIVSVPDERLDKLAEIIKPEKVTPTVIEFIDIAGLVKGAHKGEGLGNQFLAQIRNCDAILEVIRAFENQEVENVLREINPEKEIEVIKIELLMKDLETLEKIISKLEKKTLEKVKVFQKIKEGVSRGELISEINLTDKENLKIKEYQFLTTKPTLFVLNTNTKKRSLQMKSKYLQINLKDEEEISELSESDKKELGLELHLDGLVRACYDILDLITFFTVSGGKETRAWTITKGSDALEAGKTVHSDFKEKFIKAEVVNWKELVLSGSWSKAREKGLIAIVGKDYLIQDGDVVEFKI
ncbi:MAG: redox-regulated ATPase YchF [Candidatus Nealsonbacteria bacterium]|nr:MAG: redox-regulated ATPase YchF [Candidatus Nealsonbacteria bacterium]